MRAVDKIMQTQGLAAQQTYRALLAVARARQSELERALAAAASSAEANIIRAQIANTRNAIAMAERIG